MVKESFFEPGKYKIKYGCVDARLKSGMEHEKQSNQDSRVANRQTAEIPARLTHERPGDNIIADRSLHRDTACTRDRIKCVLDMDLAIDRPPFFASGQVYHDENDPEVDAIVMHRQMTIDRSSLDDYVVARKDHAPSMKSVISRPRGGRGDRLLKDSISMTWSKGWKHPEISVELECTVEQSKERPSRPRTDLGCSFKQLKGREKGTWVNLSSLRQPRELMAAEFERLPPRRGYAPRVQANIPKVLRASRSFQALDGFNPAMFDDCDE